MFRRKLKRLSGVSCRTAAISRGASDAATIFPLHRRRVDCFVSWRFGATWQIELIVRAGIGEAQRIGFLAQNGNGSVAHCERGQPTIRNLRAGRACTPLQLWKMVRQDAASVCMSKMFASRQFRHPHNNISSARRISTMQNHPCDNCQNLGYDRGFSANEMICSPVWNLVACQHCGTVASIMTYKVGGAQMAGQCCGKLQDRLSDSDRRIGYIGSERLPQCPGFVAVTIRAEPVKTKKPERSLFD